EAGLPHAGLPHDGDELPVAVLRTGERPAKQLDFGVAADEPRQSSRSGSVEASPKLAHSGEGVDLYRVRQAFYRDRPTGRDLDVNFSELQRRRGEQDRAWRRHLLHAGCEVGRLTNRCVVQVKVSPRIQKAYGSQC